MRNKKFLNSFIVRFRDESWKRRCVFSFRDILHALFVSQGNLLTLPFPLCLYSRRRLLVLLARAVRAALQLTERALLIAPIIRANRLHRAAAAPRNTVKSRASERRSRRRFVHSTVDSSPRKLPAVRKWTCAI